MISSKYNKLLTIVLIIVILGIVALLIYLGIDFYHKSQETSEGEELLGQFDDYINEQRNTVSTPTGSVEVPVNDVQTGTGDNNNNDDTGNLPTYNGYLVEGKMEIPKIDLECVILEAKVDTIQIGVGRLYGPGLNEIGNNVIIGHNYRNGTLFSDNDKLEIGDKIYITDTQNRRVEYEIYRKYITDANDFDYAERDTNGKREISLSTCTDDVSARLILWAAEV